MSVAVSVQVIPELLYFKDSLISDYLVVRPETGAREEKDYIWREAQKEVWNA